MTTDSIPTHFGDDDLNQSETSLRNALAAEVSPDTAAEHLRMIHALAKEIRQTRETEAALRADLNHLTWHAEVTNDRLAHLETRKPKADYESTRRELKARCLADALMNYVATTELSWTSYAEVVAEAVMEANRQDTNWPTLLAAVNAGRPDPFGPPSDATKALVLKILRQRAEQF